MRQRVLFAVLLFAATFLVLSQVKPADNVYIGFWSEVSEEPRGLKVEVVIDSPAYKGGLRTGDILLSIDGVPFGEDKAKYKDMLEEALSSKDVGDRIQFRVFRSSPHLFITVNGEDVGSDFPLEEYEEILARSEPGDVVRLEVDRTPREFEATVILAPRPEGGIRVIPPNEELSPILYGRDLLPEVTELTNLLVDETGTRAEYDDLLFRLDRKASSDDGYRNSYVTFLLRQPLKGEDLVWGSAVWLGRPGRDISELLVADSIIEALSSGFSDLYTPNTTIEALAGTMSDTDVAAFFQEGLGGLEYLALLEEYLETQAMFTTRAYRYLSDEELEFIETHRAGITEAYAQNNYISEDPSVKRFRDNLKLIELARKVDYRSLGNLSYLFTYPVPGGFLLTLKKALLEEYADRIDESILYEKETPLGWIVVQGTGHTWRRPVEGRHDLLVIDLGGDDFYTTTAGSGVSLEYPIGVLIEFGGDDAYESTTDYSQGSGSMGSGLLIDMEGDDHYIGLRWAQGTGYFGSGALLDVSGNDTYRGQAFVQAAAIFGTGLLVDIAGDDRMEAHNKSQAFGGTLGVALLVDVAGDDYRYAKGTNPTNYGDPGIFDSWSQGCGDGFRRYSSGGIAGLIDLAGDDYTEAGNFSTGGGYYFGFGFYHDVSGDDHYVGSRYNQGFSAHQAVGVFLEGGGNDWYETRQAVAQGLAWDESVTLFIDYGGDDRYDGGTGFSQGASAHNSFTLFWDKGGTDVYNYPPGQARSGGNSYHGGTSLSLFIDSGGGLDFYSSERTGNDLVLGWPEYGYFLDLPGTLEEALEGGISISFSEE